MRSNRRVIEFLYNFLVQNFKSRKKKWWVLLWCNVILRSKSLPVYSIVHGKKLLVNAGYTYPLYSRLFPNLNNPLLELAFQTWKEKKRQISLIDVGAAVGDTIFFIESNLPNAIGNSFCIDGDTEFFCYLKKNLVNSNHIVCINAILSDSENEVNDLVRIHSGTASSQGDEQKKAKTLDSILGPLDITHLDLLKIDVDGFDGKVLAGSRGLIRHFKPNVIFEWHPILYSQTKNNVHLPFIVLKELGYSKFLFFTKYGIFSHYMIQYCSSNIENLSLVCENNYHDYDWHYDVVALPDDSSINLVELAECRYAKAKSSPF